MNYLYFLQKRTQFIREFRADASLGFTERKRKIEAGEEPYEPHADYEDDEPPFLDEWMRAEEALDVLGQMCISLLATSLHLYLKEWINDPYRRTARTAGRPEDNKEAFEQGWINGYRVFFRNQLRIDWDKGPANLALLEEIVLARNRAQHNEDITTFRVEQSERDAAKYPRSFFADDRELELVD